jgi:plastocyanin
LFRAPKLFVPLVLVAGVLFVVGCGGSSKSSSNTGASSAPAAPAATTPASGGGASTTPAASGGENLTLSADPSQLKFDKSSLSAKAGSVTLTMDNPSSLPHAIAVEGNGVDKDGETVMKGGKSTITVDLKPGKYTFYCPVDGHRAAGMQGTLTVS